MNRLCKHYGGGFLTFGQIKGLKMYWQMTWSLGVSVYKITNQFDFHLPNTQQNVIPPTKFSFWKNLLC
jgi:hypothetical protein